MYLSWDFNTQSNMYKWLIRSNLIPQSKVATLEILY